MSLHLFAGLRVRDFQAARPWYKRLLGEPAFFPHATEAVWTLAEDRSIYIVEHADGAGNSVVMIFLDDLDTRVIGTEWAGDDVEPAGAIALFELQNGLLLSLYPRAELAKDAKVPLGPPKTGEFSIGHAVASKAEVDALLTQAQAAGATLTDRPHDRPWGIYSGYFRDPDGHLWEVLWNPRLVRPQE